MKPGSSVLYSGLVAAFGLAGPALTAPPSLKILSVTPARVVQMQLQGQDGFGYALETSASLSGWQLVPALTLSTTGGVVVFSHDAGTARNTLFFRAREISGFGPTVQVTVQAKDPNGGSLHFAWRATEGTINNVDAPSTSWRLPAGPGLHFAYVLVSNGKGGYTERRVAVSTDNLGVPAVFPLPVTFAAPPAPAPTGNYFRSYAHQDATLFLENVLTMERTASAPSDARGFFTIPRVPPGRYYVPCSAFGGSDTDGCGGEFEIGNVASQELHLGAGLRQVSGGVAGLVSLNDGSPGGTINEFFGKEVTARATLLDAANNVVGGPIRVDSQGTYQLFYPFGGPPLPSLATIRIDCEGATPVTFPASFAVSCCAPVVLTDSVPPSVTNIIAALNGANVGKFLPPPSGFPSDKVKGADRFLAFKGIDSRKSAWKYYQTIGAIKDYNEAQDVATGAISFDDWKRQVKIAPYVEAGRQEVVATYVNKVDLNLTRIHHSISYGPDRTAAYVCNHLGPTDDTQAAIDTAIDNAATGKNLVACVAMDYGVTPGVNGDQPFTRFLIFGPSGQLLPSVNLDGRREKFVPGVCVVCHGGDRYAGFFPADGTGSADIGAHFLPYDTGNFEFSSRPGLTEADLERAIHALNQNVLNAGPTPATRELVEAWYASGTDQLDKNYTPPTWQGQSTVSISFYHDVYARSCRTCHVAMSEPLNFDHYYNMTTQVGTGIGRDRMLDSVCAGSGLSHEGASMPNSLRTFDLFWGSAGTSIDQPLITERFLQEQYHLSGIRCRGSL